MPKANYEEDINSREKLKLEDMKGGLQSCKNARKEPNIKQDLKRSVEENDRKLLEFMEKKRMLEERERQRQAKIVSEQRGESIRNRERVLSACGIRHPQNLCTCYDMQ